MKNKTYIDKKCNKCSINLTIINCDGDPNNLHSYTCKPCRSKEGAALLIELKQKIIAGYGGNCACCGIDNYEFLTIDHIFADRKKDGKLISFSFYRSLIRNNFPSDRYQLLCWNCNGGKRIGECCPHQKPINLEDFKLKHNFENKYESIIKLCTNCGIELNENNSYKYHLKTAHYKCKKCDNLRTKFNYFKLKEEIFKEYDNQCKCCGENNIVFLNIDHIDGAGSFHRKELGLNGGGNGFYLWLKKNNYPKDNFQILCYNCNCSKECFGYCPHAKEKSLITI